MNTTKRILTHLSICLGLVTTGLAVLSTPAAASRSGCATNGRGLVCINPSTGGDIAGAVRYHGARITYQTPFDTTAICNSQAYVDWYDYDDGGRIKFKVSNTSYNCRYGFADIYIPLGVRTPDPSFSWGQFSINGSWTGAVPRALIES